jgi:Tol biopolymer transport system component
VTSAGTQTEGHWCGTGPAISHDGRLVAFLSFASDLVVTSDGTQADADSHQFSLSADGRYVSFESDAKNLGAGQNGIWGHGYVHDLETGTTELVTQNQSGEAGYGGNSPAVAPGGRYAVFVGYDSDLVPGDVNGDWDLFLRDRELCTTELIARRADGSQSTSNGGSTGPLRFDCPTTPATSPSNTCPRTSSTATRTTSATCSATTGRPDARWPSRSTTTGA